MALYSMNPLLEHADKNGYGIGAFNLLSFEAVKGAVRAAEELQSPIIFQLAQVHLEAAPLEYMGPLLISAARNAKVPAAVNFDHGEDMDIIERSLELGFTSVMFDGARLSLEENIKQTQYVVKMAHRFGASCEAELGIVGGGEGGYEDIQSMLTDVEQVREFVSKTGVDALAVAIGNAHGPYKYKPNLQFTRLQEINDATKTPLVLHGGSGISDNDFRESIRLGIQKINVATSIQQRVVKEMGELFRDNPEKADYFNMNETIENAVCECIKDHLSIFMSNNKAWR